MAVASAAVIVVSLILAMPWSENPDILILLMAAALAPAFIVPGAMIASKEPGNAVGWVLCLVGFFFSILIINGGPTPHAKPGTIRLWVSILTSGLWAPPIFTLLSVMPLIFPSGSLPSRRWRIVIWMAATGMISVVASAPFDPVGGGAAGNPIANKTIYEIGNAGASLALVASIAAMVGMVRRFRRSRGTERDQMTIFVSGVVLAVIVTVANFLLISTLGEETPSWIEAGFLFLSATILSVSIAVAILRHKLFDINVVISKTLVYGALAVIVTGLYIGLVVGVGSLFGRGNESNLGLSIVATAVAAIAFQPLRARAGKIANRIVYGKRSTPYEALSNLSEQLRESYASEDLLVEMARIMAQGTGAKEARVWMRSGDTLWTAGSWPRELPRRELPVADDLPMTDATLWVPVRHVGELLGALSITKTPGDPPTPTEERLVTDLGAQAGLVLHNSRLTQELLARLEDLKASRQRLVKAQDEERRRIERNLRAGAQQQLVALKVRLGLLQSIVADETAKTMLGELATDTGQAIDDLRDLARGIYPPLLAADGLRAALSSQAAKAVVPTQVDAEGIPRYQPEVEATVYFCVLEAMQNIAKYADAGEARVRLWTEDQHLRFEVVDDGRGFDPATTARGAGLGNMADRLGALDGRIEVSSSPGSGTTLRGELPAIPLE